MKVSLSQQIYIFTASCCLLFAFIVMSVLESSQTVELAFKRDIYAQKVDNQIDTLKQLVVSEHIYALDYDADNWFDSQKKVSKLLNHPPKLSPHQQTIQNSLSSQSNSLFQLFKKIADNKLTNASLEIKAHLKARLMTQLEAIRSDSLHLSAVAYKDIHDTIKKEVLFIVFVFSISICVLLYGSFKLTKTFRTSLNEVKKAFAENHSGHFQKIELSIKSTEFESIAKAFNLMNHKLSETTVSLEVMKKVVEDRTHVLEQLSNTDPLTKIANRRALFERGSMEFSRARRTKSPLALLLLDCDLFKNINDEYGHLFGDEMLINICKICRQEIRDVDFLARYGGEEFIIILPSCDVDGGIEIATRIQRTLAKNSLSINNKPVCATLSIGIGILDDKHKDLEHLINDADQAMYLAKEKGRNRIEVNKGHHLH